MSSYLPTIPGQGAYLQSLPGAQSAYEQAVAKLTAQRRQQQYLAGLNADWSVDPLQQYGQYQQMLQNEGGALDQAAQQSQERGLFGSGLANQSQSALRYGQAAEQLGFKNQLSDWENQYQQGMAQAKQDQGAANLAAMQGAMNDAFNNYQFTPYDGGATQNTQQQGPLPPSNPWNPRPTRNTSGGYEQPRTNGSFSAPTSPYAPRPKPQSQVLKPTRIYG